MTGALAEFQQAMEHAGLTPPLVIHDDGRLHRFASNGEPGGDAGYYVFHPDGVPAGMFGCWRLGKQVVWCSKARGHMTDQEWAAHRNRIEASQHEHEHANRVGREKPLNALPRSGLLTH